MTENRTSTLTLWDSSGDLSGHTGLVYRWNGYSETDSVHSLFRYVEDHSVRLRRKYLAWINELGESRIDGKRLIDHLAFEDGLSYWWMTLFVEQSLWKSPSISDAIRLLALEEIVVQQRPGKLRLVSVNRRLHKVLSSLCHNLGIAYEWEQPAEQPPRRLSLRGIYRAMPQSVQALISLARHLRGRWPLRQADKSGWFTSGETVFFCSYLNNVDPKAAEQGRFHSYYWTSLHALLNRIGCKSNWLQLFIPSGTVRTPRAAMSWVQRFNEQRQEQGFHTFVDAYLSWRVVLRVLRRWLRLNVINWHLSEIKHAFRPQGTQLSLWPLMRGDWLASMCGPVAISNLLWIELFEKALRDVPHQKKGLYLCENHAWERALIHSWRKYGHGQLIGVVHATVRFWDLRYFTDPRTVRSSDQYSMPRPHLVALNSKAAIDAYLSVDYPKEAIAECEALRYGYLRDLRTGRSSRKVTGEPIKVLLLGDSGAGTTRMLRMLEAAAPHISARATYTVKPHPNLPIRAADYPSLHLDVIMDHLGQILHDFDIAFSSNRTSATVDAYLAGMPVVVALDETELNLSPLRSQSEVRFVSTPEELAEALQAAHQDTIHRPNPSDFFFLEPELPRWSHLLANSFAMCWRRPLVQ